MRSASGANFGERSPRREWIFCAKRGRLATFLPSRGYVVSGSEGAIYLWVRVPENLGAEVFFALLLEHGVIVSPGESFGAGGEGYFRMALVPTLEQIDSAIAVWERITF